ncbi:MAG TPA: MotA/TolQ/ExbB proton channel family protein, partial [Acidobacteria bacterium]|nr:MotA/TolQ/ExbB proton channel family protein [Acidobacteriota bacterium]
FDRLKRNLVFLSFASVVSPALGFLGTAVGMVAAFYEISIQDSVTPADLALSIQIALITTVIGLVLKTLAMLLKTFVMHSIARREDQLYLVYQRLFER